MNGYTYCACRDCMEIAIGESGKALCHACEDAGCELGSECGADGNYNVLDNHDDERDMGEDEAEDGPEEEPPVCPLDGGDGIPLGGLGNLMHYRCRACGMNFSHTKE